MGKKILQMMVYKEVGNYDFGFDTFYKQVRPTNPKTTCDRLKSYINSQKIDKITEILSEDFIYPGCLKRSTWTKLIPTKEETVLNTDEKKDEILKKEYEVYETRPLLEALFFEHKELFYLLICAVIKSKNLEIYELFINKLENTDIPKHIFAKWNPATTKKVQTGIIDIEKYSGKLLKEHSEKGHHALALSRNLASLMIKPPQKSEGTAEAKLEWLHFKLTFLKELHSKDEIFSFHRGWKRTIANIASFILTGCLLNAVKYCWTRNALLCNKTESQKKVENLHHLINSENWFKKAY